jgi:hypothetical protein
MPNPSLVHGVIDGHIELFSGRTDGCYAYGDLALATATNETYKIE